jgi:succinate dehydrogenase / fumarate reductase iron-sulfur subunit
MFESLGKVKAWSELDGLRDEATIPRRDPSQVNTLLDLSSCIMCGACMEACPQVNDRSPFEGAFLTGQVLLSNLRGGDVSVSRDRLDAMKGPGGIGGCSNAQVCHDVCPKGIPLKDIIARVQWDVTKHSVLKFLRG